MIRIKHDGKCRKIAEMPKSIENLKAKIAELFGTNAAKLEVTYKDCDGELVSVVDSEDLKNCIEEAESFKMTCVTLLLKNGGRATRSVSSKKSAQIITETDSKDVTSGSDEEYGFEVVGNAKTGDSSQDQKVNLKLIEEKQKAEAELMKKKLIEEHQKALAELEMETNNKIDQLHKLKKDRKSHSVNKGETMRKQQKFMMIIRCMNQFCNANNIENPIHATNKIFKEVKEEFPELACNPVLLNLILNDAKDNLVSVLKTSCKKIIAQNPEIVKASEENKEKFGALKNKIREMGCGKPRHNETSTDKEGKEIRRSARIAMVAAMKDRKHQEKEAKQLQKESEKEAKQLQKESEKEAKQLQKESEKAEKLANKAEQKMFKTQNKPEISNQEKAIRAKVTALKEIFTNVNRPHLRAIVVQNLNLSAQELVPMIKASKLAKSN